MSFVPLSSLCLYNRGDGEESCQQRMKAGADFIGAKFLRMSQGIAGRGI